MAGTRPRTRRGRRTSENTNVLLRKYSPKGTDIADGMRFLNAVAEELNGRSGVILEFRTPAEVFAGLLVAGNFGDEFSSIVSSD
jgi:IS30 family transposase